MAEKEQKKNSDQLQFFLNEGKELNCPICFELYDSKSKCPMMFCSRQHNLCYVCSTNLLKQRSPKCPMCSIKIVKKNVTKNRLLVQMVAKLGQLKPQKYQQKKQQDIFISQDPKQQKQLPKNSISFSAPTREQISGRRNRYNAQPFFNDQQESQQSDESFNDQDSSQNYRQQLSQSQESFVVPDEDEEQQEEFSVQNLQKPRKIRKI